MTREATMTEIEEILNNLIDAITLLKEVVEKAERQHGAEINELAKAVVHVAQGIADTKNYLRRKFGE